MATLLFVQYLEYEYLGPMYIGSSIQRHGHEAEVVVGRNYREVHDRITKSAPDAIGFSVMSGSHEWAARMSRQIKRDFPVLPVIFGGAHPTFFPDFIHTDGVDVIVRGEGEDAALAIMDRVGAGSHMFRDIPNVIQKCEGRIFENAVRPLPGNLDEYPFPDRTLYDCLDGRIDRSVRTFLTSRGCPFHCSFCFEDAMRNLYVGKGKYVRIRAIHKCIEELVALKNTTDVRTVYFADDLFGMDRKWLYEFLPEYKLSVGLPFICLIRADMVARWDDYASMLAAHGCASAFFGVETADEALRNKVLGKQLSTDQIITAARRFKSARIPFRTYNIVGLPGENFLQAWQTLELNVRLQPEYPWCSVFAPFPGTALAEYARQSGYLASDFTPQQLMQSFFTKSSLTRTPDLERICNLQKFFQTAVLWPWTRALIRPLTRLPSNIFFTAWFGLVYFYVYWRSEHKKLLPTLRFALKNYRYILAKE